MAKKFIEKRFKEVVDFDTLKWSYKKAFSGKNRTKMDAVMFSMNETANLKALQKELIDKTYRFSGYETFTVYEPKERVINAPCFKDKIVQLALNEVLSREYNKCFISDSYGSIKGKGTHRCVDKIQENLRSARRAWPDAYIVKVDMKKFFYSIDREVLKNIYKKKIKDKDLLWLLFEIIDSATEVDEKGLPLGNTISQLSANVYLNELDQYAKRVLGLKYYTRYMDDIVAIAENKEKAREIKDALIAFTRDKLNMAVNLDKSKIFKINQGVNTVGFKIKSSHRLLRDRSKRMIKKRLRKIPGLIERGEISRHKANQMLASWSGHARYGDSYNFLEKLLRDFEFVVCEKERMLKLAES